MRGHDRIQVERDGLGGHFPPQGWCPRTVGCPESSSPGESNSNLNRGGKGLRGGAEDKEEESANSQIP